MQEFLVGLALLAIGGLVTAAVNYPEGYRRINVVVGILLLIAVLGVMMEGLGYMRGANVMLDYVAPSRLPEAIAAKEAGSVPTWVIWGSAGLAAFLALLGYIRPILGISDKNGKDGNAEDEEKP